MSVNKDWEEPGTASNVVSLSGDRIPAQGEPNGALIKALEDTLAMARRGQLQSLVATGFTAEGLRYAMWGGEHTNVYEMRGAIMWLDSEYVHRVTTDNEGQNG
jgi:hypothetical protein